MDRIRIALKQTIYKKFLKLSSELRLQFRKVELFIRRRLLAIVILLNAIHKSIH
jgi:hypothetical protein